MDSYRVCVGRDLTEDDGFREEIVAMDYPQEGKCPDCGGTWVWAEAGYVPGTRECQDCGSLFSLHPRGQHHIDELGGGYVNVWVRYELRRERLYGGD